MEKKHFIVYSKSDDYGACRTELVELGKAKAKKYYHHKEVKDEDVEVLSKYVEVLDPEEESERSDDDRFYGN